MTRIPKPPKNINGLLQQILRSECPDFITNFYKEIFSKHGHEFISLTLSSEKLYRIVDAEETIQSQIKQISYPTNPILGRCNKAGKPVFYCSECRITPFYEKKDLKIGKTYIIGEWQVRKPIFVIALGSNESFKTLGSARSLDFHIKRSKHSTFHEKTNRKIFEFLCKIFTHFTQEFYVQSAGISDFLMTHPNQFVGEKVKKKFQDTYHLNGIQYPAIRVKGNIDNFALPKCFIDNQGLQLIRCELVRILDIKDGAIKLETINYAVEFPNDQIIWKNDVPKDWQLREEFLFSKKWLGNN